jgi:hypothetical protein
MTQQEWIDLGFNPWVAEALEGRAVTREEVIDMSVEEMLDHVFEWHGLIGFTTSIIDAVDNCRNMEAIL